MAGKLSAKGGTISLDDSGGTARAISSGVESYDIEWAVSTPEVTGFGDGWQNYTPGLPISSVTLNCYWDTTATTGAWTVIRSIIGSATSKTISIVPEAAGLTFSGEFMCAGVAVSGTAQGEAIKLGAVKFVPMGSVIATWA